jgi:hypothetical protein
MSYGFSGKYNCCEAVVAVTMMHRNYTFDYLFIAITVHFIARTRLISVSIVQSRENNNLELLM